jgi:predicted transcriptional regulator
MNTLTIRIPDKLCRQLQTLSRQKKMRMSDLVRESLRRYVAMEHLGQLRNQTMPFAAARGFLTDEDVFRAVS